MFEPQKSSIIRTPAAVKRKAAHVYVRDKNCLVLTVTVNTAGDILWVGFEPENQVITPGLELPADPNCNFHLFGQMGQVLANHFTVSQTALLN